MYFRSSYLSNYYYHRQASGGGGLFASDSAEDLPDEHDFGENITIGYVIAMKSDMPLDQAEDPNHQGEHKKRICFIYSITNGPYGPGEGATYSWTVDKTACLRNIRPGHAARQRFNTSVLETCGASLLQRTAAEQVRWATFSLLLLLSCGGGAAKL